MKYLLSILLFFCSVSAHAQTLSDRYLGVLKHSSLAQDQLARLDIIREADGSNSGRIRATLVLYFGDYTSDEYASYHYQNVRWDEASRTLIFDGPEREVIFVLNYVDGQRLEGDVKTGSGHVGRLILSTGREVNVERPLVQKIWGEYRGICDGVGRRLQVQSTPLRPIATNRSDPFAPFIIMAQIGDNGGAGCPLGASTCVTKTFIDADYDIFSGHIDFHGPLGALACTVDDSGLTCGGCRYNRSSTEVVKPGIKTLPTSQPNWSLMSNENAPATELDGLYQGFIHLKRRDIYHSMSLAVTTYREGNKRIASLVASVRYGGHTQTDESINTKFDARALNGSLGEMVFDRADQVTDMIIKIKKIGGGVAEGTWYSRKYGFVGNFILTSAGNVSLADTTKLAPNLSGSYTNGKLNVYMSIVMADREISSKDPFSPLIIEGNLWLTDITTRKPFTETAYDPFTGKFSLETDGPGGAYIGYRTKNGLKLKMPNQGIHRPMQPHSFIELQNVSE
ncbi:MAG: hypothetical protein WCL28_07140 [bacterium]